MNLKFLSITLLTISCSLWAEDIDSSTTTKEPIAIKDTATTPIKSISKKNIEKSVIVKDESKIVDAKVLKISNKQPIKNDRPTNNNFTPMDINDSTSPGILVVTSYPEDTKILLNNREIGIGNATVQNLAPGKYLLAADNGKNAKMKEVVVLAGGVTREDISVKKQVHIMITPGSALTLFKDDQNNMQSAVGPSIELGVSIKSLLYISQDFHWGLWSRDTSDNITTSGTYSAIGGNMNIYWQHMMLNDHIGLFLGAGMGFYAINDYYFYYYDSSNVTPKKTSFTGSYFGSPSVKFIFGGPLAYGLIGYDLRAGSGVAHSFKLGIGLYF